MDKPSIILFSRQDLTLLFARITPILSEKYNIFHVAYCRDEKKVLQAHGIEPHYTLLEEIENYSTDIDLETIDNLLSEFSGGNFNINSAVISDRTLEGYSEQKIKNLIGLYYIFWEKVLAETSASFIFHEIVTHLYNHIASAMIRKNGGIYLGLVPVMGLDYKNFKFIEYDDGCFDNQLKNNIINRNEIKENSLIFNKYRNKIVNKEIKKLKKIGYLKIIRQIIYEYLKYLNNILKINKDLDPNNYWITCRKIGVLKLFNKIRMINFNYLLDLNEIKQDYYYFPLHIEPESVLLHWSAGAIDQYSIIEQVCRALPLNTKLVIKEHWVDPYTSKVSRLKDLRKIHNLSIAHPKMDSLDIIKNSLGVISVNGTALFEAYLLEKEAYMLGNNYYRTCESIRNVDTKGLKVILNSKRKLFDLDLNFITKYHSTNYAGNIEQYFNGTFSENNEIDNNNIASAFEVIINGFSGE